MRYIFFSFLLIFSCFARASSISSDTLVVNFLTHLQKMTLHFEQVKTIPEIEKSFKSSGIFQFERNKGIIIKQEKPNIQNFISTTEVFCIGDKKDVLKNLPHFSDAKSLVDHLLDGDMSDLNRIFEITYSQGNKIWQLDMVPTQKDMKNFIQKIIIKGDVNTLQKLMIEYTDGTKMEIYYSPIKQDLTDEIKC